jgi:MYXO-CTERM domain-containing protein
MPDYKRHEKYTVPGPQTLRCAAAPQRLRALLTVLAAAWFVPGQQPAHALEIGEIEPRSSLGEPFAARVPLVLAANEEISLKCIRILPHPDAGHGMPLPPRLHSDIETIGEKQWIAIRTPALVTALMVGLRIEVDCNRQLARNFVVLLNPAPRDMPAPQADSPPTGRHQSALSVSATAPTDASAGTGQRSNNAGAEAPATNEIVRRKHDVRPNGAQAAARKGATTRQAAVPGGEFVLRIDAGTLDVSRSERITEAQRESLRAIWRLTADADDGMAARLAIVTRIQQLEENLAALRSKLEQPQTVTTPVAIAAPAPAPVTGESEDEMPWRTGAALALLGLAGSLWWRRRRRLSAATAMESAARTTSISTPPAHEPADAGISSAAPVTPAAAARPFNGTATVQLPRRPPLPAAPPVFTGAVETPPAAANVAEIPAPTQALDQALKFIAPDEDRARAAQEAYFAGRFGAHSQDIKILQDIETVIEQARSIYQDDGDPLKAADMLELTIALRPDAVPLWLALFAIYGREFMARQYALLAHKFGARYALDPNWPLVQQLGREIDADNLLYGSPPSATDADGVPTDDTVQSDFTDEWLGVQLDFNSSLLAAELRERLLSDAAAHVPPLAANAG